MLWADSSEDRQLPFITDVINTNVPMSDLVNEWVIAEISIM